MPLRTGFWMIAVISADPPTHYSLFLPLWGVRRRANEPSNRTAKQLEGGSRERDISVRGLLGCGILCLEGGMKPDAEQPVHFLDEDKTKFDRYQCESCGNTLLGHEKYHQFCFECAEERND